MPGMSVLAKVIQPKRNEDMKTNTPTPGPWMKRNKKPDGVLQELSHVGGAIVVVTTTCRANIPLQLIDWKPHYTNGSEIRDPK